MLPAFIRESESMQDIEKEIASFRETRERLAETSRQIAALQLLCGIDLANALGRMGESRERTICRIRRAMERERLKGVRGQAGYDLDRHIALKRSLEQLGVAKPPRGPVEDGNGARRRRSDAKAALRSLI